jgi:hypothetical protein
MSYGIKNLYKHHLRCVQLETLFRRYQKLKRFRLKRNAYTSFQRYLKNIKNFMKDRLLSKRLALAKHNDQSMFDDRGNLMMLDDDSIIEHNFFEVRTSYGSSISYMPNPVMFGDDQASREKEGRKNHSRSVSQTA